MKKVTGMFIVFILAIGIVMSFASEQKVEKDKTVTEANVWLTDDGQKHFICPVMGGEGVVDEKTTFSIVDGKKYYHCCAGCSEKFTADSEKYLKDFVIPANVVKQDKDGKHFLCPVMGEMGIVGADTKYSDYNGKRYYFCCANCKPKFDADPSKFIPGANAKKDGQQKKMHQH